MIFGGLLSRQPNLLLLRFFGLQANPLTNPTQVRPTFGFGYKAAALPKRSLPFFSLLPRFQLEHPTHNRVVKGGGPTHWRPLPFKSFWANYFL